MTNHQYRFRTGSARPRDRRAALCLVVTAALCAAACTPSEPSGSPARRPSATVPASTAKPGGATDLAAALERSFGPGESFGSGSGPLDPQFGNTHPSTPDGALSVTFAFTCTGKGEVALTFSVDGQEVPAAAGTQVCDGTLFQRSIEVPEPGPIGFVAAVTGSADGSFAYAFYAEKERLP
jgi:hypothetical protein